MIQSKPGRFMDWARPFLWDFCCARFPLSVEETFDWTDQEFQESMEHWSKISSRLHSTTGIARPKWVLGEPE